jgi:hypothetical protein
MSVNVAFPDGPVDDFSKCYTVGRFDAGHDFLLDAFSRSLDEPERRRDGSVRV